MDTESSQRPAPDEGMPQERTLLSWRRTALTLSIATFALARLAMEQSLLLAGILILIAIAVIITSTIYSAMNYFAGSVENSSGTTAALLTIATCALAVTEIILIFQE
jgi:uncharacterized membrane protein YidH (DUF202 family)